jgi:V8-like Glu-specific endopeptidase
MSRFLPALTVAVVLLPACCAFQGARHPASKLNAAERDQQVTAALVRWVALDEEGDPVEATADTKGAMLRPYCASTWISKDVMVTAAHCVENLGKPAELRELEAAKEALPPAWAAMLGPIPDWDPTGQAVLYSDFGDVVDTAKAHYRTTHPASVLAYSKALDLALVQAVPDTMDAQIPEHLVARIASEARVGDEVDIVGHPIGLWWSYTHGWIAQFRPYMGVHESNIMQISAAVYYGNSGGGAFNADGELLGVCSFMKAAPNSAFYVQFDTVRDFVTHHSNVR